MFLTLLLVDFFHEDWTARSCELRSQEIPFRLRTGDYRPLPSAAMGLSIGAESIFGSGWSVATNSPYDPVDRWVNRSDDLVEFEVKYSGVTPPMKGIGAYNLVLPPGWRFKDIQVENPQHVGETYALGRDDQVGQEALLLYFQGDNTRFSLKIQGVRGLDERGSEGMNMPVYSRHIADPASAAFQHRDSQTQPEQTVPEGARVGHVNLIHLPRETSFGYGPWPNRDLWLGESTWAISGGDDDFCILRAFLRRRGHREEIEGEVNLCEVQRKDKHVSAAFPLPKAPIVRTTVTLIDNLGQYHHSKVAFGGDLLE